MTGFEPDQSKPMHFYLIRSDLRGFQHVHPTMVVVEMTDSARTGWTDYLAEAERNRDAVASLGLVRTIDQNGGQTLRVIGAQRLVLAFDPDNDSLDLLRTVIMLLRTTAVVTASRKGVWHLRRP